MALLNFRLGSGNHLCSGNIVKYPMVTDLNSSICLPFSPMTEKTKSGSWIRISRNCTSECLKEVARRQRFAIEMMDTIHISDNLPST